jgi:hypothetical protein
MRWDQLQHLVFVLGPQAQVVHQRGLAHALGQCADEGLLVGLEEAELDLRVPLLERGEDARRKERRQRGEDAHHEVAGELFALRTHQVVELIRVLEHGPGTYEQAPAGNGQPQPAIGPAVEELDAQFALELAYGRRQGRLGDVEFVGRGTHVLQTCDGGEVPQLNERERLRHDPIPAPSVQLSRSSVFSSKR